MITDRQIRVMEAIRDHERDHGFTPTYATIAQMVGRSSKGSIHAQITILVDRGYLRRVPNGRAGLEIIKMPGEHMWLRDKAADMLDVLTALTKDPLNVDILARAKLLVWQLTPRGN